MVLIKVKLMVRHIKILLLSILRTISFKESDMLNKEQQKLRKKARQIKENEQFWHMQSCCEDFNQRLSRGHKANKYQKPGEIKKRGFLIYQDVKP